MARTDWVRPGGRIYLDANVIVYFIERQDRLQRSVAEVFAAGAHAGCRFVVNEAGVAECFHGVFRIGSADLEDRYRRFFADPMLIETSPVDGRLLLRAARLGAAEGLGLVDATHVVSALECGATHLLTNDRRMRSPVGIEIVQLGDL